MTDTNDDDIVHIQAKIKRKTRRDFKAKCLVKDIDYSEWIRQQIEKFLKEDKR